MIRVIGGIMLEIKKITKTYETAGFKQKALDNVSVNFRECEFASILGPSGSGKTTFLNIIGGLDHYDSGDLIINEISTKQFRDSDWDSYRNHRIGFVFQSYNLISHQTVLSNVKLALTLSGIPKGESIRRAKQALKDVGLGDHMYKKPNQLSGGQMQRVAIARALVNDPEILLADEPTGALDSETSVQIMKLLKKISKTKLVIMVTHNPELANEYSNRIINLKDGKIVSDTNPYDGKVDSSLANSQDKSKKTRMSFLTALSLSLNNLLTKKGRTILVAFAGSIGIIGIALILATSNGFQKYIDSIQEDTLTSYPLTVMYESTDITGALLSMRSSREDVRKGNKVKEQQYITSMLSNISTNDLKSFKKYIEDNYKDIEDDLSTIKYMYSVDPLIYTVDTTKKIAKLNPNNLFDSFYGSSSMMSSYSSIASIFSQMIDNEETLKEQYDLLAGKWPKKYDEMIIVLSESNSISDLLVYSLGLRDTEELANMITKIMAGEKVEVNNKPLELTYEDLLDLDLRLIEPVDLYKFNTKYDVYENMSEDKDYMKKLYDKATKLKIVGIVTGKEGNTSMALNPGVAYRKELVDHIISNASKSDIVKKQMKNSKIDVFSGKDFDSNENKFDFEFSDLVSVDEKKLSEAFNMKIDQETIMNQTQGYMGEISNEITTDINPAKELFHSNLNTIIDGLFKSVETISLNDSEVIINNYLSTNEVNRILTNMEKEYVIPKDTLKTTYNGLLKGLLPLYITSYVAIDPSLTTDINNPTARVVQEMLEGVKKGYLENAAIIGTEETMAKVMTEAKMKKNILTKVGELTNKLMNSLASAFNVDQNKITSAFKLNFTEDELARVVTAMMTKKSSTLDSNLLALGYQDIEKPTFISFYFNSFEGKEHFLDFIEKYNKKMEKDGEKDKAINYSDTTGILMDSVKTIVNAVSYVLIAFVSISLVVSSIMIGIITYISVLERTKEIGILRAIGASKRNISSIFNAETVITGFLSGIIGIGISYVLIPIINVILYNHTHIKSLKVVLELKNAIVLVILSVVLTLIGGLIPAKAASRKDPVEALRTE